jgi:uncharacterized membrane protein
MHVHPRFATITALFLATAPFHIYYSQEARMYAMTTFFTTLSMYYFMKILFVFTSEESPVPLTGTGRAKPTSEVVLYILATTLMLYSGYYGLFVFLAQIIASLIILKKDFTKLLNSYIATSLSFFPCLPLLWIQLKTGAQAIALLPEWGRLVNINFLKALPLTFIKFSIGRITIFNKTFYAIVAGVLFLVYGLTIIKGFFKGKKLPITNYQLLITFWLFIPILFAWLISLFVPNYQPFRLLLVLPAFYLLLVYGIFQIFTSMIRIIVVLFVLVVNLSSTLVYYTNPYFHREDWRGTVGWIEQQAEANSLALMPSYTSHWPYVYYTQGKVPLITASADIKPLSSQDFDKFSSNIQPPTSNIFYIYYLADLFDPQGLIPNWLEGQKFAKIREVSFNQILVQEWQR